MYDKLEIIGQSIIQHGKYNDRIYLMELNPKDLPNLFTNFKALLTKNKYSKIIAKVPEKYKEIFINKGYVEEANIPNFYYGKENMMFLAKYYQLDRKINHQKAKIENILKTALKKLHFNSLINDKQLTYKQLSEKNITDMAGVYKKVFKTYPFPIFEEDYLKNSLENDVIYFGAFKNNVLVGISSCEINYQKSYVEMTDFAILEKFRGNHISLYLLNIMEEEMIKQGIKKAYTMARALSYGMNITFAKMGYAFTGTVINNANIFGEIESLNIWHKDLKH